MGLSLKCSFVCGLSSEKRLVVWDGGQNSLEGVVVTGALSVGETECDQS